MQFTDESLDKIEKVFNYPLAQWQRDFLLSMSGNSDKYVRFGRGNSGRHNGVMLCLVLHLLLGNAKEPIMIQDFDPILFEHYIKPIYNKLVEAGYETNLKEE